MMRMTRIDCIQGGDLRAVRLRAQEAGENMPLPQNLSGEFIFAEEMLIDGSRGIS